MGGVRLVVTKKRIGPVLPKYRSIHKQLLDLQPWQLRLMLMVDLDPIVQLAFKRVREQQKVDWVIKV